jgi:vacuolar-type H+-ATPase subunit I/STV1
MRKRFLLVCLTLPWLVHAAAESDKPKTYRWVDKEGVVHFSSTPPPPGVKAEEIELRQPGTVIHQENREQTLEQGRQVGERVEAQQQERQQLLQQIDEVKAALLQANEAHITGEAPLPGELQHLAGGGNRLSAAYHQRREAEAKRIEQLQQQLDDLYKQLNKLR